MVYPDMFGNPCGAMGHPSGHRHRRSPEDFCTRKNRTQFYMRTMTTLASEQIINNVRYRRYCRQDCENSFLQTDFCDQGPSANITVVLQEVMTMMCDLKDLIRGQAQDNHSLLRNMTHAFSGIAMACNNAISLINITLQAGCPMSRELPAIAEYNGRGQNKLRRGYTVARDIIDSVSCSLNMVTTIC